MKYKFDAPEEATIEIDGETYHGGDTFDLPEGHKGTFAEGVVPADSEPAPDAEPPQSSEPSAMAPDAVPDAEPPTPDPGSTPTGETGKEGRDE